MDKISLIAALADELHLTPHDLHDAARALQHQLELDAQEAANQKKLADEFAELEKTLSHGEEVSCISSPFGVMFVAKKKTQSNGKPEGKCRTIAGVKPSKGIYIQQAPLSKSILRDLLSFFD